MNKNVEDGLRLRDQAEVDMKKEDGGGILV